MAIKKCLMKGEMTKVNKVVDKRKPATRKDQRVATKQEAMFDKIMADKKIIKEIEGLSIKKKITVIQNEFKRKGIAVSRQKINRMLKGEIGIPKPVIKPKVPITEPVPTRASKPTAWKSVTTIDEAKAVLKERFAIDNISFDKWSLKDKDKIIKYLNTTGETLEDLKVRFPNIKRAKKLWDLDLQNRSYITEAGVRQAGLYYPDDLRMVLRTPSDKSWMKKGLIDEKYPLKLGQKTITDTRNFRSTLRHEYGHHYHRTTLQPRDRVKWSDIFDDYIRTGDIADEISDYAAVSADEAFAEAFAAYTNPFYDKTTGYSSFTRLSKTIEDFMKRVLGR